MSRMLLDAILNSTIQYFQLQVQLKSKNKKLPGHSRSSEVTKQRRVIIQNYSKSKDGAKWVDQETINLDGDFAHQAANIQWIQ